MSNPNELELTRPISWVDAPACRWERLRFRK